MSHIRPTPLLLIAIAACTSSETITSPEASLATREARAVPVTSYSATDLGTLPGDEESLAWAVNDAGSIAMQSNDLPASGGRFARWYMKTGNLISMLDNGGMRAVSGGSTTYVIGTLSNTGSRRTYSTASGFSEPTPLAGYARAVNELGDAVGETAEGAAIMKIDGSTIVIPNPDPSAYPYVEARDINNAGDIVISYQDGYQATPDRGHLRTAEGVTIEFAPLSGHNSTYVRGLSQRIAGKLYVAGISDDDNGHYNAIRWTVDLATNAIVATEVGSAGSYKSGMSDDGMVIGTTTGSSAGAFVWKRGESMIALKTPKGLNEGRVFGVSGNGRYVVGAATRSGSYPRAVLWTAQ